MKYNRIKAFVIIALISCIAIRTLQLFFTIDEVTGFHIKEFENYGRIMTAIIFAFALFTVIFSLISHKKPEHPPKQNPLISLLAVFLSVTVFLDALNCQSNIVAKAFQETALLVTGFLASLFFLLYAISGFVKFNIPKVMFLFPTLFYIIKLAFDFLNVSSIAMINDSVMHITSECFILIFMLQFAKLYFGMDSDYNFRKIMASGFATSIFCLSQTVSQFIYVFFANGQFRHLPVTSHLNLLAFGLFSLVFTFCHFGKKNCE